MNKDYSNKNSVSTYMLQKEIFQFLKLNEVYSTKYYHEYLIISKITKYFTQGFLLCSDINLCKNILPSFMQEQFKQYFTQQIQPTNEILSFIEENKKIHELIAERYMLQKLLE